MLQISQLLIHMFRVPEPQGHLVIVLLCRPRRTLFLREVKSQPCTAEISWEGKSDRERKRKDDRTRRRAVWPPEGKEEGDLQSLKVWVPPPARGVSGSSCPAWPTLMKLQILAFMNHPAPFSSSSAPTWSPFHKERGFLLLGLFLQLWGNQTVEHAQGDETF